MCKKMTQNLKTHIKSEREREREIEIQADR